MLLETAPPGLNLARAYARLAQLLMVAGHDTESLDWGQNAVALGESLGAEGVVVHALNTVGTAEMSLGIDDGLEKLEESLRRAQAAELHEDVARALGNLMASAFENKRHDLADRYREEAVSFAAERDLDLKARCIIGDLGKVMVEEGRWDEAAAQAQDVIDRGWFRGRTESLLVLGRVAARRGDGEAAFRWLDQALDGLDAEMWGKGPCEVRAAWVEAAWLQGDMRLAAKNIEAGLETIDEHRSPWLVGEFAFWAHKVGLPWEPPTGRVAEPYALYLAGHPDKAAAAWAALGCPYEEAQNLAESDEPSDLRRALDIFQSLGARPMAARTMERLRALGETRISRGPRDSTRSNPAGLSNREVDVLVLLVEGLRNAEIAERLTVSTRTVDHHVSALLTKLGAENRSEAVQKASELDLGK
jgi:DNA-binding CsgD family transcriptional regulator/tetratricopeptide (TPR) repeat protein